MFCERGRGKRKLFSTWGVGLFVYRLNDDPGVQVTEEGLSAVRDFELMTGEGAVGKGISFLPHRERHGNHNNLNRVGEGWPK